MNIIEPVNAIDTRTRVYPDVPIVSSGWRFLDEWARASVNATGVMTQYTSGGTGAGSVPIAGADRVEPITGSTLNDDIHLTYIGTGWQRDARGFVVFNTRNQLTHEQIVSLVSTTDQEVFVGMSVVSAISSLPTTGIHLGMFQDTASSSNWILSSGNGSAQSTTDSGVAGSTSAVRLKTTWTGSDSATIELFTGAALDTLSATHTVTSINGTGATQFSQVWVKTLAAASKQIRYWQWSMAVA